MLKHASRSGQPGARVAACQTHLARRPVQTRARILPKQGRCPEAHQPARTTSPRSVRLGAGSPRAPARATQRTRKTHSARGGRPLRGAPIAFQKCGHDFDASSRARAPWTYQRRRGTAPGVCQQASIDHELRLQAPQHGWSRRRVFVRSVLGPTVEPCGDDRCVVARHATVSGLDPKQTA